MDKKLAFLRGVHFELRRVCGLCPLSQHSENFSTFSHLLLCKQTKKKNPPLPQSLYIWLSAICVAKQEFAAITSIYISRIEFLILSALHVKWVKCFDCKPNTDMDGTHLLISGPLNMQSPGISSLNYYLTQQWHLRMHHLSILQINCFQVQISSWESIQDLMQYKWTSAVGLQNCRK